MFLPVLFVYLAGAVAFEKKSVGHAVLPKEKPRSMAGLGRL